MRIKVFNLVAVTLALFLFSCTQTDEKRASGTGIQPFVLNPSYWQYNHEPILLLGGSSNHNIFQHDSASLEAELARLIDHGGNYLRNTLSFRAKGEDVFAFYRDSTTGLFDLDRWNEQYWQRLEYFLKSTHEKGIIVQIELWETYDFYSRISHLVDGKTAWERNPFNPVNNTNYNEYETGLSPIFHSNGQALINPFFNTTIPLAEPFDFSFRPKLLGYQQRFIDKILSVSLEYNHVLYCIDNETQADPKWSLYWAQYIRARAKEKGREIEITEMWDPFDPSGGEVKGAKMQDPATHFFTNRSNVRVTLENPDLFTFVDISNHNAQVGETHFNTAYHVWTKIQESGIIRPMNNVKIYGAGDEGWNGNDRDGQERFWRNIFAGAASVRFHRPPSGLGSSDVAMAHVKSMRMLTNSIDFFSCLPANQFLSGREEDEAYCMANGNNEFILVFMDGGEVGLEAKAGAYEITWLNILESTWMEPENIKLPGKVKAPAAGFWAARVVMTN